MMFIEPCNQSGRDKSNRGIEFAETETKSPIDETDLAEKR
jgi:hypothetical protein